MNQETNRFLNCHKLLRVLVEIKTFKCSKKKKKKKKKTEEASQLFYK